MINEPFLMQFEPYLISQLNELKGKSDAYKSTASYDVLVTHLEKMVIFINRYKKENNNMSKTAGKIEFGDLIDLDDIPRKEASESVKKTIREQAMKVPKGKGLIVNMDKWGTFSNAVAMLKKEGSLTNAYRAQKRGNVFILRHDDVAQKDTSAK